MPFAVLLSFIYICLAPAQVASQGPAINLFHHSRLLTAKFQQIASNCQQKYANLIYEHPNLIAAKRLPPASWCPVSWGKILLCRFVCYSTVVSIQLIAKLYSCQSCSSLWDVINIVIVAVIFTLICSIFLWALFFAFLHFCWLFCGVILQFILEIRKYMKPA